MVTSDPESSTILTLFQTNDDFAQFNGSGTESPIFSVPVEDSYNWYNGSPESPKFSLENDTRLKFNALDTNTIFSKIANDIVPKAVAKYVASMPKLFYNVSTNTPSAQNLTATCISNRIPSAGEYLYAINVGGIAVCSLGALVVITILGLYIDTLKHILKHVPARLKTHTAFTISVYPVVAIVTYCAIIVPRAHLLAETITQGMFMACLYQLFCLFIAYSGGESELIRKTQVKTIDMKVPPCCCYPCCVFLPSLAVNKKNIKILRLLVLQPIVVQSLVYLILLVMWAEEESLYQVNYLYLQPVVIASILTGIWGMSMTMRTVVDIVPEHQLKGKFICLQLVLILAKLQGLITRLCVRAKIFPCRPPVTPSVYGNLIYNSAMLWEMMVLCSFARMLYKKYLPEVHFTKSVEFPKQIVCVIDRIQTEGELKFEKKTDGNKIQNKKY